jgi:hypothetical protein
VRPPALVAKFGSGATCSQLHVFCDCRAVAVSLQQDQVDEIAGAPRNVSQSPTAHLTAINRHDRTDMLGFDQVA